MVETLWMVLVIRILTDSLLYMGQIFLNIQE